MTEQSSIKEKMARARGLQEHEVHKKCEMLYWSISMLSADCMKRKGKHLVTVALEVVVKGELHACRDVL